MKAQANKPYESQLVNLISAMLVYPGFKYSKDQLKECGIYEFMDAVKRSQIYTSTIALTQGAYSGFMDTKNIKQESLTGYVVQTKLRSVFFMQKFKRRIHTCLILMV